VLKIIGSSGELTFESEQGTVYLTGSDIKNSQAGYDKDGKPIVLLEFTSEGATKFANATGKLKGSSLYIKLDGETVSSPKVDEQIVGTGATITGLENYETAQSIASVIKAGKLPLEFEIGESNVVSASLGENAIKASLIAGVIGILVIFAIMCIKYKGLGISASLALSIYVVVFIVLLAIVPWIELTLPGIAGIILSIGMAVDANVIIFEGIKEEYKSGKTVVSAVNAGFKRAFFTILDSNVTTILSAIVLGILCPGSIKGFAMTLLLGVVLSMVTAILITKYIVKLLLSLSSNNAKFFNLKRGVIENEEVL
jgi:protein-export membrane protein SecD